MELPDIVKDFSIVDLKGNEDKILDLTVNIVYCHALSL
jgi:hypothetical protein